MEPNKLYTQFCKANISNREYLKKLKNFLNLAAAVPKFGRIAIFRNLIPHSARPPAPTFLAARYTFPVKVSCSCKNFLISFCLPEASKMFTNKKSPPNVRMLTVNGCYESLHNLILLIFLIDLRDSLSFLSRFLNR